MMLFKLQKNNNPEMKEAYGNYYALPVILQTMGIAELAVMMAEHNTGFSAGQVKGMLTDMVKCIKQLVLDGKAVKIDDLAIFTLGIVNKAGAATKAEFSVQKNIESVKLRARATGELTRAKLNLDASLKDIEKMVSTNSEKDGDGGTPLKPGAGSTDQKDNTQEGGGSSSGTGSNPSGGSGSDTGSTPRRALKKVPNFKLHSLFLNFNSCPRSISSFKSEILFWTGI